MDGLQHILGISDFIDVHSYGRESRNEGTLHKLQAALEWGDAFLVTSELCLPLVRWQKGDTLLRGGYWVKTQNVYPSSDWTIDALLAYINRARLTPAKKNSNREAGLDNTASIKADDIDQTPQQQSIKTIEQVTSGPVALVQNLKNKPLLDERVTSSREVASATNTTGDKQALVDTQTPIQIILLVPGTTDPVNANTDKHGANSDYWKGSELLKQLESIEGSDGNIILNHEYFSWSGDNSVAARGQSSSNANVNPVTDAGLRFKDFLYRFYQGWKNRTIHLHLIGHSHGGNVMNEFTQAIKGDFPSKWKIKSLTYLSTPFFNHLHPIDSTHFHQEAKMLLVHNKYDLTQQAIANYSVVNLEKAWEIGPLLEQFMLDVINVFKAAYDSIASSKNLTLLMDLDTTAEKWQELGIELIGSADTLVKKWTSLKEDLASFQDIIPPTFLALGDSVTKQYYKWADATNVQLNRQADKYTNANVAQHLLNDYFNRKSLLKATNPDALVRILVEITGGHTDESRANSQLMTAIDDLVSGIVAVFDDTHRVPSPLPDNVSIEQINVSEKDAYYGVADAAFSPFIDSVENNQHKYQEAVEHKGIGQQKKLRQAFIFTLLAQLDFSIIVKLHDWANFAETAISVSEVLTTGELDTLLGNVNAQVGKLKDNLHWLVQQFQKRHYPLMVVDDLLFSYCRKYQLKADTDNKTLSGFREWIEDNVRVDQARLIKALEALALSDNASLIQLARAIKRNNEAHRYNIDPKSHLLDEKTLRGSLAYLAITSHSVSRNKLYELSPDVKQAFMSCL